MDNKTILNIEPVYPESNAGWLDIKLSKTVMDRLDQYISVANISKKGNLAGQISRSLILVDEEDWFFNNCLVQALRDFSTHFIKHEKTVLSKSTPYVLQNFWVNFQKQHEFNPVHDHGGLFSFVIFVKIPTDWRDQHEIPFVKESNSPKASDFEFIFTNMFGQLVEHPYWLDPSYNGRMLFFPAQLKHTVYPFYDSEEERITISGNIMYHTEKYTK